MDTRQNHDFDDFCGDHSQTILADIHNIDRDEAGLFFTLLESNPNFTELERFFNGDVDKMARFSMLAFYENKLTRQQTATILEYRSMILDFKKVRVVNIFTPNGEFSQEFLSILSQFANEDDQIEFKELMRGRANYECCYFKIDIDTTLLTDPLAIGTLQLANNLSVIHYVPSIIPRVDTPEEKNQESIDPTQYHIHYLGTAMRDVMTQAIYGDQAKNLFPRLGIFNIDDIERSVRKYGRYSAIDYPGIACAKEFHGIKAPALLNTLHDELHRRLISTIPNPVFSAYLHLIDIIREKTQLAPAKGRDGTPLSDGIFSKEIWEAVDMECGLFINATPKLITSTKSVTNDFISIMSTRVYSENSPVGLCPASPYIDTTWLILIDMVLNKQTWRKYQINTSLLASHHAFGSLYEFVKHHQDLLRQQNTPAKQVALIKSLWFDLPYDENKEAHFRRKDNYVELLYDKQLISPTQCSKRTALSFLDMNSDFFSTQETIANHPALFLEFMNRVAKDKHEFDRLIITREQFDFLIKFIEDPSLVEALKNAMSASIIRHIKRAKKHLRQQEYIKAISEYSHALSFEMDVAAKQSIIESIDMIYNKIVAESQDDKQHIDKTIDAIDKDSHYDYDDKYYINEDKEVDYINPDINEDAYYTKKYIDYIENVLPNNRWDSLHYYATSGNLERLAELLDEGADPTVLDYDNCTPIILALRNKNIDIFHLLFNHMSNTGYFQNKYNLTQLLIEALNTHQLDLALFLVNEGADINAKTDHGWTALHFATASRRLDIVVDLLNKGANTLIQNNQGLIPLIFALQKHDFILFETIFEHMAGMNITNNSAIMNYLFTNALYEALVDHRPDLAKYDLIIYLIEKGANINTTMNGWTALHIAAQHNQPYLIQRFLSMENINCQQPDGWTALHFAAANGSQDIILALLNKNASTLIQNAMGDTPILLALHNNHIDVFKLLFRHMLANGDFQDENTFSVLCDKVSASGNLNFNTELMYLIAEMPGNTFARKQTKPEQESSLNRFFQEPRQPPVPDTSQQDASHQMTTPKNGPPTKS